jgi:hypothetical protein
MNTPVKILVGVLAAIGALAIAAAAVMTVMHFSMMGGRFVC